MDPRLGFGRDASNEKRVEPSVPYSRMGSYVSVLVAAVKSSLANGVRGLVRRVSALEASGLNVRREQTLKPSVSNRQTTYPQPSFCSVCFFSASRRCTALAYN